MFNLNHLTSLIFLGYSFSPASFGTCPSTLGARRNLLRYTPMTVVLQEKSRLLSSRMPMGSCSSALCNLLLRPKNAQLLDREDGSKLCRAESGGHLIITMTPLVLILYLRAFCLDLSQDSRPGRIVLGEYQEPRTGLSHLAGPIQRSQRRLGLHQALAQCKAWSTGQNKTRLPFPRNEKRRQQNKQQGGASGCMDQYNRNGRDT